MPIRTRCRRRRSCVGKSSVRPPRRSQDIEWHEPIAARTVAAIVNGRARQAGLGHVAAHDLRRTAAGLRQNATSGDGAYHFDLLDIQRVLRHADPATTMRSYLEPVDTQVLDRAAAFLD